MLITTFSISPGNVAISKAFESRKLILWLKKIYRELSLALDMATLPGEIEKTPGFTLNFLTLRGIIALISA